jgi:tetratricopeptide (TPR) repeat protein
MAGAFLVAFGLALAGLFLFKPNAPQNNPGSLIDQAQLALNRKDYRRAEQLALEVPQNDSSWVQARFLAGEAAMRTNRFDAAVNAFNAIPRDGSPDAAKAAFFTGEAFRAAGRLSEAERSYASALETSPDDVKPHTQLAFLQGITGQRWESRPHLMYLVRTQNWTVDSLAILGDLERPLDQKDYLEECEKKSPNDLLVQLGLASSAFADGRTSEARRRLEDVIARSPELNAAQAMLGELLITDDAQAFANWHAQLPPAAEASPDIWFVRGLWARRVGDLQVAARCFWESLTREPTHRRATYLLAQALMSLDDMAAGKEFTDRAALLSEQTKVLDDILRTRGKAEKYLRRIVELMQSCGRLWEAWAWARTAEQGFPFAEWPRQSVKKLGLQLRANPPQVVESQNLAHLHDLSDLPAFETLAAKTLNATSVPASSALSARIQFEEATSAGIDFLYNNGGDPETKGARMFEQNGGGVGALDFDGDRFPDLYFTQGADWKTGEDAPTESAEMIDRLYRNRGGRDYVDVTDLARLGDQRFGQGCAAGDFDNDGFVDLYVANIGSNRLYRNNGDGTFEDVSEESGLSGADWTASCVIVDLNADGFPDLFDANYVSGEGVHQRICDGHACSPTNYSGTPPKLLINGGDGSFRNVPVLVPRKNAKGMGVLAAAMTSRDRPSLFVANDQVPNFLLKSIPGEQPSNIQLEEEAFLGGLAINDDGLSLACMGIAADDFDGNGLIDFFVTNFKDEPNSLYRQDSPGLFVEVAKPSNLAAPSWSFVGWGTQALDADLDGNPDLVLVNGHVDDFRDVGGGYKMRPQFFHNQGDGRFEELMDDRIGPYFGRQLLGRGLSRLDWNCDGRMDFVVSNIGDPAALVTNRSEGVGHFLNVRLHATASARDAIGTVVDVVTEERTWTKQLVAGDGYMASNERVLQFGLGRAPAVKEIRVHWPSGAEAVINNPPIDTTIELVESPEQWVVQSSPQG